MTAPQDPYGPPGAPARRSGAQVFSILAIVCGVLAILFVPILFGPLGVILALVGRRRADPLWKVGLAVAIGGMVLGLVLGYAAVRT